MLFVLVMQAGSTSGGDEGNQLELLQQQHEAYAQQVEDIRKELERSLGTSASGRVAADVQL